MPVPYPIEILPEDLNRLKSILDSLRPKYELWPTHPQQSEFQKLCLQGNRFRTEAVLDVLCDSNPMDTPFKTVLAAGLCGWVIDPTDNQIAESFMHLEVQRILQECVDSIPTEDFGQSDAIDIIARYLVPGDNFYKDVRFPIQEQSPHEFQMSSVDLEIYLSSQLKCVNSLNYCLLALQWISEIYDPKHQHLKPSWSRVRKFASQMRVKSPESIDGPAFQSVFRETRLWEGWIKYKRSFPMLYAANYVSISRNRTLLEMIFSTDVNTRALLDVLPEWLEKSAYYYDRCLKPLKNTARSSVGEWLIKNTTQTKFRAVRPNDREELEIRRIIKNPRISRTKRT